MKTTDQPLAPRKSDATTEDLQQCADMLRQLVPFNESGTLQRLLDEIEGEIASRTPAPPRR